MGFFSAEEQAHILHAISVAENRTSGEIRVAVEKRCGSGAMDRAAHYFNKLGMHRTRLRNGVLIYLATEDHEFAIIGDQGINKQVPAGFWEETRNRMAAHFRQGHFAGGIIAGISHAGEQLFTYFPVAEGDINELPDEIVFGNE